MTAYTILLPTYYNVNCKILYIRERERERDVGREIGEEVKGYAEIKAVMMDRVWFGSEYAALFVTIS